jgi:hypothetical protein
VLPGGAAFEQVVTAVVEEQLQAGASEGCVAFRQTGKCQPDGPREPHLDRSCQAVVPDGVSGYCECVGVISHPHGVGCRHGTLTCASVCDEIGTRDL